jgi:hypothetical protein
LQTAGPRRQHLQRRDDVVERATLDPPHRNRSQERVDHDLPEKPQAHLPSHAVDVQVEPRAMGPVDPDVGGPDVVARAEAVGHDAGAGERRHSAYTRVVAVKDRRAARPHRTHHPALLLLGPIERPQAAMVLAADRRHDDDVGLQHRGVGRHLPRPVNAHLEDGVPPPGGDLENAEGEATVGVPAPGPGRGDAQGGAYRGRRGRLPVRADDGDHPGGPGREEPVRTGEPPQERPCRVPGVPRQPATAEARAEQPELPCLAYEVGRHLDPRMVDCREPACHASTPARLRL